MRHGHILTRSHPLCRGLSLVIVVFWVRPRRGARAPAIDAGHGKVAGYAWGSSRGVSVGFCHDDIIVVAVEVAIGIGVGRGGDWERA